MGLFIPTDPDPTFGWFHAPPDGADATVAVLICPPFGWEDFCSYRPRRAWAEHLADRGHPVLRIDLPSMGDGGGSPRDSGRLEAWTAAVGDAAEWLRVTAGSTRVAAIGIGLGGLVAVKARADGAAIDDLVLWAVAARGRTMLRELRAFAMLNAEIDPADATASSNPSDPHEESANGSLEVGGFLLNAETVATLRSIDLAATPVPASFDLRVLMLERDGMAVDGRLHSFFESSGVDLTVAPGPGYTAMTAHPQESEPPTTEFATVDSWLAAAPGTDRPNRPSTSAATHDQGSFPVPFGDTTISEMAITIPQRFGDLRGILAEPTGTGTPNRGLCAVFLNAGALRRIGPGRLWVDTTRSWAANGVPTVRIDLEGIGDSDGDSAPYRDTGALYDPKLVSQVIACLDHLTEHGLPTRFVIVGLCSGAYWGFHTAIRDERVSAAFLINPRALFWDPSIESSRNARKAAKVFRGSTWRRFFRGEVPLSKIGPVARGGIELMKKPAGSAAQSRERRSDLADALERLTASDTRILLAFGGNEPLADELDREGSLHELHDQPGVKLATIPGSDHTLRPIRTQQFVREMLDQALQSELGRVRPAP